MTIWRHQSPRGTSAILLLLLGVVVLGLSGAEPGTRESPPRITITLASGTEGGNYIRIARAIQQRALAHNIVVNVLNSGGSVDNINLLRSKVADFALVQSDISQKAARGHLPFAAPIENLRLVTPLFTEAAQILVRSDLYILSTDELRGKIVSFGPKGSGTEETARAILEASGVSIKEVEQRNLTLRETAQQLDDESIDVAFLTESVPFPTVKALLESRDGRLLLIDARVIDRLVKSGNYVTTTIPASTYPGQPDDVPTVGVEALLLSRDDCDPMVVSRLLEFLKIENHEIEGLAGVQLALLGSDEANPTLVKPHTAAASSLRSRRNSFILPILGIIFLIFFVAVTISKRNYIRQSVIIRKEVLSALLVLFAVWVLASAGLYYFERHVNENFESFGRSMWSMVVYIAGGFQSRRPITQDGEIVAVLSIVCGVGVVAWFIAELASHFVKSKFEFLEHLLLGRNRVPDKLEDHIVIVNWDYRTESMIRQLHGPDILTKRRIVVLSQTAVQMPAEKAFEHVYSLTWEAGAPERLRDARIPTAHSVTILSSWQTSDPADRRQTVDADSADGKTILTILGIRAICADDSAGGNPPITAEIRSLKNSNAAIAAGKGGPIEVVCVERFGAGVLTQCALTPGLASVYDDLLTFEPDTDEIYKIPVPHDCVGKSFSEALRIFSRKRHHKSTATLPIGICRGGKVRLNPPDDDAEFGTLHGGDFLFVIADNA